MDSEPTPKTSFFFLTHTLTWKSPQPLNESQICISCLDSSFGVDVNQLGDALVSDSCEKCRFVYDTCRGTCGSSSTGNHPL